MLLSLFWPCKLEAGGETFPAGHWAYDIIDQLIVRGYLTRLYDVARPYERLNVARAILETDKFAIEDRVTLWLFQKLEQELEDELGWLRDEAFPRAAVRLALRPELITERREGPRPDLQLPPENQGGIELRPRFRGRGRLALYFDRDFVLYNSTVVQQVGVFNLVPTRPFAGATSYNEQAYFAYHGEFFRAKLGRDYVNWGYGRYSLSLANTAGPLDQLMLQLNTKTLRFTYLVAMLEKVEYREEGTPLGAIQSWVERYLTAFRVDLNLFASKVRLGVWQGNLYGGRGRPLDLRYLSPFAIYYSYQYNNREEINPIGGFNLSIFPFNGINIYGSFVIDDWQFNVVNQTALEPNLWAGQLGIRAANVLYPLGIYGTDVFFEIARAINRTYHQRQFNRYQRWMYDTNPLAHPLGTDFESLEVGVSHWFFKQFRVSASLLMIGKGEGSLYGPFTEPWLDTTRYNLRTGYSEPAPFGIVERRTALTVGFFYQPSNAFNAELNLTPVWRYNANNIEGARLNDFQIFLRVLFEIQPVLSLF
ncbi:MAG: capsule assembly Wzi family protein [Chloroherpetonaceae bacterium]|nr:capsule assembly Wzi family protein [Chloroherpetonaceae bacterium]